MTPHCASHLSAESSQIFFFLPALVYFGVTNKIHDAILGTRIRFPMTAQTAAKAQVSQSSVLSLWL